MKTANPKAESAPIDVASQAVAVREEQQVATIEKGSPLDLPPAVFKAGLERRGENRAALMTWIRAALVDGVDFGKIHVVGKDRCRAGRDCTNPSHFSKPCLYKPGAEKICGMLGVTPTFPRLVDYENACLTGVELKHILLRCEMVNAAGQIVGHGAGARTLEKDYNDLNKSLKMAEKSAMADACLRMAGLSEVFTQDDDDNPNLAKMQEPARDDDSGYLPKRSEASGASHAETQGRRAPTQAGGQPSASEPRAQGTPLPQTPAGNPTAKAATPVTRQWMIDSLDANPGKSGYSIVKAFFENCGWMLPTEALEQLELRFVPVNKRQLDMLIAAIDDFSTSGEAKKPYEPNPEAADLAKMPPVKPGKSSSPNVQRGTNAPAVAPKAQQPNGKAIEVPRDDAWRSFPLPWGKLAGVKLGALADGPKADQNYLYGFWASRERLASPTFEGTDGAERKKRPEALAKDRAFLQALESAGASLGFTEGDE